MKLHASAPTALYTFSGYGDGYVVVNGERHGGAGAPALVVTPERLAPWSATSFEALTPGHFEELLALRPEIVLLGTGARQRFPHPRLTQALARERIGLEAMDVQAACRTYNILMAESRRVAAAILFA